jgi:hypothetical protein
MQKLTPDFVYAQIRLALVAAIAYLGGRGTFTPADVTLAGALVTSLLPIAVPWAFSIFSNWGTIKVSTDSKAAVVAAVEKTTDSKAAAISAIQATPEKV